MSLQGIGTQGYPGQTVLESKRKTAEKAASGETAAKEATAAPQAEKADQFVKSSDTPPVTYSKNKLSGQQVDQLVQESKARIDSFNRMIQGMVAKQGQKSNLTLFGQDLFVSPEDSARAAKSLEDGGEWSVDAVAGRIMDMAKALSGGDPEKISVLRDAVKKGFGAAADDFGSKLPDICSRTYDECMKRFDEWEQEPRATAE